MFDSGGMPAAGVRSATLALARCGTAMSDRDRIDLIRALEDLKGAAAAVQARLSVAFDESQRRLQEAQGVPARERGRGIGAQLALARRESPHRGSRYLGLAKALVREMPHTMAHLEAGRISEWRATLLCRETAMLSVADRGVVDQRLAEELPGMSDVRLVRAARGLAASLDADAVARRAARAAHEWRVSLRPAPETMTVLTGLLPVAQGVAAYAALDRHARERIAAGDGRGRGQIMADTLVERVTGQARFLTLRDKTCRTPWCDAPVRHSDHVHPASRGGPTTAANGQGLCAACNQAKQCPGWHAQVLADGLAPGTRHRVRLTTPTGHTYDSTAPPLLESPRAS